jgi:hypothetical protein
MKTELIGPFTVSELNVDSGLDLMAIDDPHKLQKSLLLRAVTKDGAAIGEDSFAELMPHLAAVVKAAMRLNGFVGESS